jgi:hypothetical protein
MLSLQPIPDGFAAGEVEKLVAERPDAIWGNPVVWPDRAVPRLVYICSFQVPAPGRDPVVHLLGTRHALGGAVIGEKRQEPGGYVAEYVVATNTSDAGWQAHRLLQRGSIPHAAVLEVGDYCDAEEIRKPAKLSLNKPPAWKPSEAQWPTVSEEPMLFVGQAHVGDTPFIREHLSADTNIYLFWKSVRNKDCFKIFKQPSNLQTAEEHYAEEEARWKAEGDY